MSMTEYRCHMQRKCLIFAAVIGLATAAFRECWAQMDVVKPPTRSQQYKQLEFESKEGVELSYWVMTPVKVDRQKKYPLVLALHGRGGNTEAATVLGSAEMREKYPCFVIAPAVSKSAVWSVPKEFRKLKGKQLLPAALEVLEVVKNEYPIDSTRVYVTGQSMGGFGTFGAIAASPQTFAAAIPVCGGWDPADAERMKSVKIWVFHGGSDRTVPVERSRNMVEAIKQAGGSPKYTEYPDVGHNSWSKTYASSSTWDWLFAQRRTN